MKYKYFIVFFMMFLTFSTIHSQPNQESLTRKERKALKKSKKNQKSEVTDKMLQADVKTATQPNATKSETPTIKDAGIIAQSNKPKEVDSNLEIILEELTKNSQEVLEVKPNGNINWTQQYIEAVGQAVIDNEKFKNPAQAKLMATRGAVVVAQRNLLEIVKGVHIVGETTVQDMMTTSDYVYTRVDGVIKGAQQVGEAKVKDGYVEVRLKMPIYGNGSLANTFDDKSLNSAKKMNGFEQSSSLQQTNEEIGTGVDGTKPILFNIENNGQIDPSMFPVIVDEKGKVLFDFSKIYNPNKGSFPQYLQLTKDILQAYGNDKGVDLINIIQTGQGQFKIPESSSKKVFWNKVARVAQDVGTVLFKLIL
uniref:LPP20 family lipoprotein n=1 Tax=Flavobacterium sp. TaxID=239 RepID=UPI00404925E4